MQLDLSRLPWNVKGKVVMMTNPSWQLVLDAYSGTELSTFNASKDKMVSLPMKNWTN